MEGSDDDHQLLVHILFDFHSVLHGFRTGCVTGNASLDSKLLQYLVSMREEVLYVIFLDMHKAYDALDRDRCMDILEGHHVGTWACHIFREYGERHQMVNCAGRYYKVYFNGF